MWQPNAATKHGNHMPEANAEGWVPIRTNGREDPSFAERSPNEETKC